MAFLENGVTVTNYFAKIVDLSPYADESGALVFGNNSFGQLGIYNQTATSSPVFVGLSFNYTDIAYARSGELSFFVNQDNKIYYSGRNSSRFVPSTIRTTKNWAEISSGTDHSVARDTDGKIWAWGINSFGQLGTSDLTNRSTPVQIGNLSWNSIVARSSTRTTYGIQSGGYLWAWGNNSWGQLGVFNLTHQSSPIIVGAEVKYWKQASTGRSNIVLAIQSNGILWSWGNNTLGQLGLSDLTIRSSPTQIGNNFWKKIGATTRFVLAIQSNGTLWAWGNNSHGQLGISDLVHRSSPVQASTNLWNDVGGGFNHAVALQSNGTLWAWGNNANGQLGLSDLTNRLSPTQIGTSLWSQFSSGSTQVLAIQSDGTLWAWGNNVSGQLGTSDTTDRSSPVQIGSQLWSQVSSGDQYSSAIRSDGTLWAWGRNDEGQLGTSNLTQRSSPVQVGTSLWKKISVSFNVTAGIQSDGTLWAWGNNSYGQLGTSDLTFRSTPTQIGNQNYWSDVVCGYRHVTSIRSDGTLWVWGQNSNGQLGQYDITSRLTPTQVGFVYDNWAQVSTGVSHTLAVQSNGSLWGWGRNNSGQLGQSNTTDRLSPVQVGTSNIWKRVECGGNFTLGQQSDGTLWAWGVNGQGQLGTFNITQTSSPVIVGAVTKRWKLISVTGYQHSVNILTDGTLWSWGLNQSGQLGTINTTDRSSPIQIGTGSFWTKTALGSAHTMALQSNGTLWTWGNNFYGNLGTSNLTNRSSPAQLGALLWKEIACPQNSSSYAIQSNGTLWSWGWNFYGQLGLLDRTDRYSPVQVGVISTWNKLGGNGNGSIYAIQSDGTLWAWGNNVSGQLGTSDTTDRSSPVQIGTSLWREVTGGNGYVLAIQSDGTLWSWGSNFAGKLGTSDTTDRLSPVQVGTGILWTKIAAGDNHSMAIQSDGTLWVWGRNNVGQLGLSDLTNRSSPVQVGTETYWAQISAHAQNSFALDSSGTLWSWGYNQFYGELGLFDLSNRSTPSQHGLIYNNWASFSAGQQHAAAVQSNGTLWTCGYNNVGQLGTSDTTARIGFFQLGTENYWSQVVCGYNHTLALQSNGTLWAWGRNSEGQIGVSTTAVTYSPIQVGTKTDWSKINAGSLTISNAIDSNNILWSWGINSTLQLGLIAVTNTSFPIKLSENQVYNLKASQNDSFALDRNDGSLYQISDNDIPTIDATGNVTWSKFATGLFHFVGIKPDGTVWSIGSNSYGQLGLNDTSYRRSLVQIGTRSDWSKVSCAEFATLLIDNSFSAWVFGKNNVGQLGTSDQTNRSSPVQLNVYTPWISAADSGSTHNMLIRSDGTLWGIGNAGSGRLGTIDTTDRSSPVQVDTSYWKQVAGGLNFTHAIKSDGSLWAWGLNDFGQLGLSNTTARSSPVLVNIGPWKQVSCGYRQAVAIKSDGTLWAWGLNTQSQLGNNTQTIHYIPVQIGTDNIWSQVSMGSAGSPNSRTLAIKSDGTLWAWGNNNFYGGLGTSDTSNRSTPVQIGTNLWSQVSTAGDYTLAIQSDGTLWSWGRNNFGQLGHSNITDISSPVQVGNLLWKKVATGAKIIPTGAGRNRSLAIQSNGTLWTWGNNSAGILSQGDLTHRSSPVQIGTGSNWAQIFSSDNNNLAIQSNGTLWVWGENASGQLGLIDTFNRTSPVPIDVGYTPSFVSGDIDDQNIWLVDQVGNIWQSGFDNTIYWGTSVRSPATTPIQMGTYTSWKQIVAAPSSQGQGTFAIRTDGTMWVWGYNAIGMLGTNDTVNRSRPTQLDNNLWSQVSCGYRAVLAIQSNGTLWAWGNNSFGQIGNNSVVGYISSPVRIGTSSWIQVNVGSTSSAGIQSDGTLWAWGNNVNGQLGLSNTTNRSSPVQVGTELWKQVVTGNYTLAIQSNGTLWAWGVNGQGQLGLSNTTNRSSPVQVGTNLWRQISGSSNGSASFAIRSDGTLWAWGSNLHGVLALSSAGSSFFSPVQVVGTGTGLWKQISCSANHVLGIQTDGTLWRCGYNISNRLGTNDITNRSFFVQFGTEGYWAQVSAGGAYSLALQSNGYLWGWGDNIYGNIGDWYGIPYFLQKSLSERFNDVYTNKDNTFFVRTNKTISSVGNNSFGALGLNSSSASFTPTIISFGAINTITKIDTKNFSVGLIIK